MIKQNNKNNLNIYINNIKNKIKYDILYKYKYDIDKLKFMLKLNNFIETVAVKHGDYKLTLGIEDETYRRMLKKAYDCYQDILRAKRAFMMMLKKKAEMEATMA